MDDKRQTQLRETTGLIALVTVFGFCLELLTYPLWTTSEFPAVPWFQFLCKTPYHLNTCFIIIHLVGTSLILAHFYSCQRSTSVVQKSTPTSTWCNIHYYCGTGMWLAGGIGSVLLNQQRLQAWWYQFTLLMILSVCFNKEMFYRATRLLIISIYFYSAINKFDITFSQEMGPYLLSGLLKFAGFSWKWWPDCWLSWVAWLIPCGELLIAVCLFVSRTQLWGLYLSWIMHVTLLCTLGPWGLNHEWGVFVWNLYFIVQNYLLFGRTWESTWGMIQLPLFKQSANRALTRDAEFKQSANRALTRDAEFKQPVRTSLLLLVLVLPLFNVFAGVIQYPGIEHPGCYCDHWVAWNLYSTRIEKVSLYIDHVDVQKLPHHLQQDFTAVAWKHELFAKLNIKDVSESVLPTEIGAQVSHPEKWKLDRWSLRVNHAPLTPQVRYQLALIKHMIDQENLTSFIVVNESLPDRFSGARQLQIFATKQALEEFMTKFWFNHQPENRSRYN